MIDFETVCKIALVAFNMVITGYACWCFTNWALGAVCWRWKRHRLPYKLTMPANGDVFAFRSARERDAFIAGMDEGLRLVKRIIAEEQTSSGIVIEGLSDERSAYLLTEGADNEAPPGDATIH